ncbi:MAG TPA: hypothetical protein VGF30_04515 [Bacteroidia bacterium]
MVTESKGSEYIIRQIDHPIFSLQLRSDGIVQMNTGPDAYFTIKEAREYVEALEQITEGKPHLILKIPGLHASVDSETRMYVATPEALRFSLAEAVVVNNIAQRILGNFYIKFDKPPVETRLFDTVEDAENWLATFNLL